MKASLILVLIAGTAALGFAGWFSASETSPESPTDIAGEVRVTPSKIKESQETLSATRYVAPKPEAGDPAESAPEALATMSDWWVQEAERAQIKMIEALRQGGENPLANHQQQLQELARRTNQRYRQAQKAAAGSPRR